MDSDIIWLEGFVSIQAALQAQNREVQALYLKKGQKRRQKQRLDQLQKTAVAHSVPVQWVDAEFIQARVSGSSHGGMIAAAGPRRFVTLDALLARNQIPFVVMLDGVEDPFNFGQAVRALYAAGVDGLVVRPRNWLSAAGVVARASAGATEWMPTAVAETAEAAAEFYRESGLTVACTSREAGAVSIYQTDLTGPLFLLLGGEKRGITRSFLAQADLKLEIPYGRGQFKQSLGAAAAAAILGFEINRQRQQKRL